MEKCDLPVRFSVLLCYFDLIDSVYCFLTRNKIAPTLKKFESILGHSAGPSDQTTPIKGYDENALQVLCAISPATISLKEAVEGSDIMDTEIVFPTHGGVSKTHVSQRRKLMKEGMLNWCQTQHEIFLKSLPDTSTSQVKKRSRNSNKRMWNYNKGWHPDYCLDTIPLPSPAPLPRVTYPLPRVGNCGPNTDSISCSSETKSEDQLNSINSEESLECEVLQHLRTMPYYQNQIVHVHSLPALCNGEGVNDLYSHQAMAVDALRAIAGERRRHVCVATSTASGKSIIYNIPVIESILLRPDSTALYIFPTKALAQDQLQSILRLCHGVRENGSSVLVHVSAVDGDTNYTDRRTALECSNIVLSNPDMLHCTILPNHNQWRRFFSSLRYVVIDEAHVYRGVFGSHVANVMRRLVRVCHHYSGACPQFICLSATISRPVEHIYNLVPLQVGNPCVTTGIFPSSDSVDGVYDDGTLLCITQEADGSPSTPRYFALWNPPNISHDINDTHTTVEDDDTRDFYNSLKRVCQGCVLCDLNMTSRSSGASEDSNLRSASPSSPTKEPTNTAVPLTPVSKFLQSCEDKTATIGGRHSRTERKHQPQKWRCAYNVCNESCTGNSSVLADYDRANTDENVKHTERNLSPKRASSLIEMSRLFTTMVKRSHRTLAFCKSRKLVEIILRYSMEEINQTAPELRGRIAAYRGGYTKEERNLIERALFNGNMLGITTTCALELGIDIGNLDVTLHLGVPDTHNAMMQQAGRCGRSKTFSSQVATSILVCFDSPVDQYYTRHPEALFSRSTERLALDPNNRYVLHSHILCASKEVPLGACGKISENNVLNEESVWGSGYVDTVDRLLKDKRLVQKSDEFHVHSSCASELIKRVNLRMIDPTSFQVIDKTGSEPVILGIVEYSRAFYELFEGAIYMHQGRQFLVIELNIKSLCAFCKQVRVGYFTDASNRTSIETTRQLQGNILVGFGSMSVRNTVWGYRKLRLHPCQGMVEKWVLRMGGNCTLPEMEYDTCGVYINIPAVLQKYLYSNGVASMVGCIHAANHALLAAASIFVECDGSDLDTEHFDEGEEGGRVTRILLYDRKPGGVGACEILYSNIHRDRSSLLSRAVDIISSCKCENGCPSCIYSHRCGAYNGNFNKRGGALLLYELMRCMSCSCISNNEYTEDSSGFSTSGSGEKGMGSQDLNEGGFICDSQNDYNVAVRANRKRSLSAVVDYAMQAARDRNIVIRDDGDNFLT